jgi:hypothetical protein
MANQVKTLIQNYFEKTLYENGQHSHIFPSGDDTVLTVVTKTFVFQYMLEHASNQCNQMAISLPTCCSLSLSLALSLSLPQAHIRMLDAFCFLVSFCFVYVSCLWCGPCIGMGTNSHKTCLTHPHLLCLSQDDEWVSEWVRDCWLTPIQQFFSYIMTRTS